VKQIIRDTEAPLLTPHKGTPQSACAVICQTYQPTSHDVWSDLWHRVSWRCTALVRNFTRNLP